MTPGKEHDKEVRKEMFPLLQKYLYPTVQHFFFKYFKYSIYISQYLDKN